MKEQFFPPLHRLPLKRIIWKQLIQLVDTNSVFVKTLQTVVLFSHGLPLMQVHQPWYHHLLYLVCTHHEHLAILLLLLLLSLHRVFHLFCKSLFWHFFSVRHYRPNRFCFHRSQMIKKCWTWEPPVHVHCVALILYRLTDSVYNTE
jgi:hypothetical protein